MNILALDTGRVSLEGSAEELRGAIAELGGGEDVARKRHATYDIVTIRGERFILFNEWDEPCLISTTEIGDNLLRTIAADRGRRTKAA